MKNFVGYGRVYLQSHATTKKCSLSLVGSALSTSLLYYLIDMNLSLNDNAFACQTNRAPYACRRGLRDTLK